MGSFVAVRFTDPLSTSSLATFSMRSRAFMKASTGIITRCLKESFGSPSAFLSVVERLTKSSLTVEPVIVISPRPSAKTSSTMYCFDLSLGLGGRRNRFSLIDSPMKRSRRTSPSKVDWVVPLPYPAKGIYFIGRNRICTLEKWQGARLSRKVSLTNVGFYITWRNSPFRVLMVSNLPHCPRCAGLFSSAVVGAEPARLASPRGEKNYNGRTGCLLRLWEGFERRG
jgi:hypothetical protein